MSSKSLYCHATCSQCHW